MIQRSRKGAGEVSTLAFAGVVVLGLFAVAASTAVAQSSGTWALTGSLNTARAAHTATLLPNGQVLVAGGENTTGFLASAELYNPSTGKWTETGSMSTPRINHQATLLPNGQVLVSGGHSSTGALASAELFNPSTGQWTTTGSMTVPRTGHSALLLGNGQVLVVAGDNTGTDSSAELYNPAKGTWRATTSMQSPRSFTLVPLQDGRALACIIHQRRIVSRTVVGSEGESRRRDRLGLGKARECSKRPERLVCDKAPPADAESE